MLSHKRFGAFCAAITIPAVFSMLFCANQDVEARPKYMQQFKEKYGEKFKNKKLDCSVCHTGGQNKKPRNDYATALEGALGGKNVEDAEKINEALGEVAKKDSKTKDKTYGDLLEAGKMPGKAGGSSTGEKSEGGGKKPPKRKKGY